MPVLESPSNHPQVASQRLDAAAVLRVLDEFCSTQETGTLVPPRVEWMRQLNASERAVRWAIEELRRQGKIVGRRTQFPAKPAHVYAVAPAQNSRTVVAITIPDHALFDQAMKMLAKQSEEADLSLICHLVTSGKVQLSSLPEMSREPFGYILFRRELMPLAEQLREAGQRVVLLATPYTDIAPSVPMVYGNHEQGGYLATKHLIDLGHQRIAFCNYGDYEKTLRWQGHRRALREAERRGLEIDDSLLDIYEVQSWKDNPVAALSYFHSPTAPTGIVVWNDHEAAVLMGQLNRISVCVPRDVSIVGYDNLREGQLMHPALTTVHSPMDQQIQAAINILTGPTALSGNYQLVIQPTLIERESSAPFSLTS